MNGWIRLRSLPVAARVGLTFLLLTLLGGLAASATHLVLHHENRDERPGLSLDDLVGAYHGIQTVAPLKRQLEAGHPEALPAAGRVLLLEWLNGDRITERYDSLELGESAPAEIIDRNCLTCHARQATEGDDIGQRVPLEYWDDVRKVAISREVAPVASEIMIASAHTHGMTMSAVSLVIALLAFCTRWPARWVGGVVALAGIGLLVDLGGWFISRASAAFVPIMAGAGGCWMLASVSLVVLVLLDLWLPDRQA